MNGDQTQDGRGDVKFASEERSGDEAEDAAVVA